jgi:hypothetical protein
MFVKLHESIFGSSIMEEDLSIRYIWICLLTIADQEGFVDETVPALARRFNVSQTMMEKAIDCFLAPDPKSRTKNYRGRRIEPIRKTFGWRIINYKKYRDMRNSEERRDYMRDYMRNYREKQGKINNVKDKSLRNVYCKQDKLLLAKAEAETEAETDSVSFSKEKQAKPAHSSQHFSENINEEFLKPLLDIAREIQEKSNGKKAFNFYQWIQQHTRRGSHPGAMIKAGQSLLDYWQTVKDPRRYLEGIMKTQNQNFNETDYVQQVSILKNEISAWINTPDGRKIANLLNFKKI